MDFKPKRSKYCEGEVCSICKLPADRKVEEVIFDDDDWIFRHPFTAYLCWAHFNIVMFGDREK